MSDEKYAFIFGLIIHSAVAIRFMGYTKFQVVREFDTFKLTVTVNGETHRFAKESFEDLVTEITGDSAFYELTRKDLIEELREIEK